MPIKANEKPHNMAIIAMVPPLTAAAPTPKDRPPVKGAATMDLIIIPTGNKAEIEIKATIDDKEYTVKTEAVLLEQGKIAVFDATLNNSEMTLSSIQIDDWSYDSSGNPVIEHQWKVTLGGDISGISFANS